MGAVLKRALSVLLAPDANNSTEKRKLEARRQAWHSVFHAEAAKPLTADVWRVENPQARSVNYRKLDSLNAWGKLNTAQYVIPLMLAGPVLCLIVGTVFSTVSTIAMWTAPITLILAQAVWVCAIVKEEKGKSVAGHLPPKQVKLNNLDNYLHFNFHHFKDKVNALDPTVDVVEALVEAQDRFDALVISAAELHAEGLDLTEGAKANRAEMARMCADMATLAEVAADRRSLALTLESNYGQHAVARASEFNQLSTAADSLNEDAKILTDTLRQIAPGC